MIRMKRLILVVILLSFVGCVGLLPQQDQKVHKVVKGETVYSIARQYDVLQEDLLKLNPEIENGLHPNTEILIPNKPTIFDKADVHFKAHQTQKGETLYGLSQEYGVSQEVILRFNSHIEDSVLKEGEFIRIPIKVRDGVRIEDDQTTNEKTSNITGVATHTVKPKETLSAISRIYDIKVSDILKQNPTLNPDNIAIGTIIVIPTEAVVDEETTNELDKNIDEDFFEYTVEPAEGFYRLEQKFGLTKAEIIRYNPQVVNGLKKGMILKLPAKSELERKEIEEGFENVKDLIDEADTEDLEQHVKFRNQKNIALMLPLRLDRFPEDSIPEYAKDLLHRDQSLRIALDFYRGALLAAEEAEKINIPVSIKVFDTEGNASKVGQIITSNNFRDYDAVIGPVLPREVERAAELLERDNIPLFSPLTNRASGDFSNLFQTLPDNDDVERKMLDYIQNNSDDKNLIFITDLAPGSSKYQKIRRVAPTANVLNPSSEGFFYIHEIKPKLSEEKENFIILESRNSMLISNVVGMLNGIVDSYNIQLVTTDRNSSFDYHDVSNKHLARLKFTYPSVNKTALLLEDEASFVNLYYSRYQSHPSRYVIRAYDLTLDILLRLATQRDLINSSEEVIKTEYLENKFEYHNKGFKKHINTASYILQLTSDLNLKVLE